MGSELSQSEQGRLTELEQVVERGQQTFVQVGTALLAIRDEKLYRLTSDTFEGYCQVRWGFTRRRAEQIMQAANVIAELSVESEKSEKFFASDEGKKKDSTPLPATESHAKELASAPAGKRAKTWDKAVRTAPKDKKTGQPKVTAAHVRRVVREESAPIETKPAEPVKPSDPPAMKIAGHPWDSFNDELAEIMDVLKVQGRRLSKVLECDRPAKKLKSPFAHFMRFQPTIAALGEIIRHIESNRPGAPDDRPPGFISERSAEMAKQHLNRRSA